jgi:hypothetical protein
LLVSIELVNRNHIDELEIDAFRLVNDSPAVALVRTLAGQVSRHGAHGVGRYLNAT